MNQDAQDRIKIAIRHRENENNGVEPSKKHNVSGLKKNRFGSLAAAIGERSESVRASFFTMVLLVLLVLGAFSFSLPISTFVAQQNQIKEYEVAVKIARGEVEKAEQIKKQWQDPTFVRAQARERLYFVMPGETQIGVVKDVRIPADPTQISSDQIVKKAAPWRESLLSSLIQAGTAK